MKLYSSMRILPVTNNAKGQQREITLKLMHQSKEVYFSYIAYVCFIFYYERRSVLFKIQAANIESSKKFVCFCR